MGALPRSNGSTASKTDASETLELDSPPSVHSGGTLEEEADLEMAYEAATAASTAAAAASDSGAGVGGCCSPTGDEESDAESLHSFHYSPKAVDMPSASRLAKRLYNLEGFKKSDVSRHLSKK